MTTSATQTKTYSGPALLSYGFRPFFLFAGLWSAAAMVMWIAMLSGYLRLPTAFDMISWHVHEFLYGYLPAVIAGFLLTAVPNWTGRPPIRGMVLFVLALAWVAGRAVILFSDQLGPVVIAFVDLSFLALFALAIGREIVSARDWRNLKVLILIALFFCGNALFHVEAARNGVAYNGYGARLGIAVAIFLVMVIGGRIVPNFTRGWLMRRGSDGRLPVQFNRFDMASMILAAVALLFWVTAPEAYTTAILCLGAGIVHLARLARWAGERTTAEPLLLVLHIGYAFVPFGFLAASATVLFPATVSVSAATHAWTAGAIGVMTLAVMTRTTLGHVGRPLHATRGTVFIYICVIAAAILRFASGLGSVPQSILYLGAIAWVAAFVSFVLLFGPFLLRPRQEEKPVNK